MTACNVSTNPPGPALDMPVLDMDEAEYQAWKNNRLRQTLPARESIPIQLENPLSLTDDEYEKLTRFVAAHNFAVYQFDNEKYHGTRTLVRLCQQLSLQHSVANPEADANNVTAITFRDNTLQGKSGHKYIPYTRHALKWHTDGYYNGEDRKVRSFLLHCSQRAASGGVTSLMDGEIAYILLRDRDPDLASALCQPGLFTIPENIENGLRVRDAFSGTVFSTDTVTGRLYMRYTQRSKNICWSENTRLRRALAILNRILELDNSWKVNICLQPGQGLICNNILHARSAYEDSADDGADDFSPGPRTLLRMRFSDIIARGPH